MNKRKLIIGKEVAVLTSPLLFGAGAPRPEISPPPVPTLGQTVIFVKSAKLSYTGIVVSEPTEAKPGVISIYTYPNIKNPVWKKGVRYSAAGKPGTWHWIN